MDENEDNEDNDMSIDERIGWGWAGPQYMKNLWVMYKLDAARWNVLWDRQGGKCAGCGKELAHPWRKEQRTGVKPEVDHKHEEGEVKYEEKQVRGLLCKRCNLFMGKLRDDAQTLRRLADYLENGGVK